MKYERNVLDEEMVGTNVNGGLKGSASASALTGVAAQSSVVATGAEKHRRRKKRKQAAALLKEEAAMGPPPVAEEDDASYVSVPPSDEPPLFDKYLYDHILLCEFLSSCQVNSNLSGGKYFL